MADDNTNGEPPDDYFVQPRPKPPETPEPDPHAAPPPWDPYAAPSPDPYGAPPPPDPYGQPAPWGQPDPYGQPPGYGQHPVWGQPPGWAPVPPDRPVHLQVAEFIVGMASCVGINILGVLLLARSGVLSEVGPFMVVVLNFLAIVVPAVKGHKSFSAGFAAGYGAIVVIGIVACFAFFANLPGVR